MPATTLTTDELIRLRCGERFAAVTEPAIELVVTHRSGLIGVDADSPLEAILAAPAASMVATQDGRHARLDEWHEGAEAEWLYFERIAADGSGSHGWIDAESRKLLQAG